MTITVQALQADGTWAVRSAFVTENKQVQAGSLKADDLEAKARAVIAKWQATMQDGKQLRVHNSDKDPKPATRKPAPKFQGVKIEQNESDFFADDLGYFDIREELEAEISRANSDLRTDENIYGLASMHQSIHGI